jgi:hypothetical protein
LVAPALAADFVGAAFLALFRPRPFGALRSAGLAAGGREGKRVFQRHRLLRQRTGQGGVGGAVGDVGAEAAGLHHDGGARFRIVAEGPPGIRRAATEAAGAALLGDDEVDGAVAADLQHIVVPPEIGVDLAVLHVGTVAPDIGEDRLSGLRVARHLAGQGEQLQGEREVDLARRHPFRERRALRLLALAELHERPEAAVAQGHGLAGVGIVAQHLHAGLARAVRRAVAFALDAGGGELAGELAFRVVRAADEGAELAELQRELARPAGRAGARIGAVAAVREDVGPEQLVEGFQHLGGAQILGLADGGREVAPELAHHLLPVDLVVRHAIELLSRSAVKSYST